MLMGREIASSIVMILLGAGLCIAASSISDNKQYKQFIKTLKAQGLETQMATSIPICFQVYNTLPGKKTLNYIASLNPQAAAQIQTSILEEKEKQKNK